MSTILDTLKEIEELQVEIEKHIERKKDNLIIGLINFTTVMYFEFSAHAILNDIKNHNFSYVNFANKYFRLNSDENLLNEFIRYMNIGHLFIIWQEYEKYLRSKFVEKFGHDEFKITEIFRKLMNEMKLKDGSKIKEEFEVIRLTRNNLHNGGVYNKIFSPYKGTLKGVEYKFIPGKNVTPIRIMDIIKSIWFHYKSFENI